MNGSLRSLLIRIVWMSAVPCAAQQNNHWFLGHFVGIDFSGGTATPTTGALETLEGTAAISDAGGDLLFYTEGSTIWDRYDNVMPNGSGLLGGSSSTQAALIVPKTGACGVFYVFTTQDHLQTGDFRYSVVDMCLNNGNGDVISGQKNILIETPCSEKLTAVPNGSGTGYWIITHRLGTADFLAYSLTAGGFDPVPVISSVGSIHDFGAMIGPLKASHNGLKLICEKTFFSSCELFDFDPNTGVVSNAQDLFNLYGLSNGLYGAEFSPNDQVLYLATTFAVNLVYQIDLVGAQLTVISDPGFSGYEYGALQLGPDGRIYLARKDHPFLDVITDPDVVGSGCGFLPEGFLLASGTTSDIGMPCLIPSTVLSSPPEQILFSLGVDTSFCGADPFDLQAPVTCNAVYEWQDGSFAPTFTVNSPGTYWVQVTNACGLGRDTIEVTALGEVVVDLGPDTTLCTTSSIVLSAPVVADSVRWQNGATTFDLQTYGPGVYSVEIFSGGCVGIDSLTITEAPLPVADFEMEPVPCSYSADLIQTSSFTDAYYWDLGDGTVSNAFSPSHQYSGPGQFTIVLTVSNDCGTDSTSQVLDLAYPTLSILGPTTVCDDSPLVFSALLNGAQVSATTWSTGDSTTSINLAVDEDTELSVVVIGSDGCTYSDTLTIDVVGLSGAAGFYVPNVFSPNGDGINERFSPVSPNASMFSEMTIFNRWGKEIFRSTTLSDAWDGSFEGSKVPDGTYVYIVRWKDSCTQVKNERVGHVTLLR